MDPMRPVNRPDAPTQLQIIQAKLYLVPTHQLMAIGVLGELAVKQFAEGQERKLVLVHRNNMEALHVVA